MTFPTEYTTGSGIQNNQHKMQFKSPQRSRYRKTSRQVAKTLGGKIEEYLGPGVAENRQPLRSLCGYPLSAVRFTRPLPFLPSSSNCLICSGVRIVASSANS